MDIVRRARFAATLPVSALLAACGSCPDDEALVSNAEIDWNGWVEKSVTSPSTGETYTYLEHESEREGAPVMVLVHGLFFGSRMYTNAHPLAKEFRLLAWDIPDRSDGFHGKQADLALLLKDFVDTMGLTRIVLAGTSLGGQVVLEFMKHRGEVEVDGLVLIDTVLLDGTPRDERTRKRGAAFVSRRSDRFLACTVKKAVLRASRMQGEVDPQHDVFSVFRMKDVRFFRQVAAALGSYDGESGAGLVKCPTLVLHGSEDEIIDVKKTAATIKAIPQARLEIVEGAGHEGIFSQGDEFSARILDWWEG